jgi:hypothetical protein
MEAGPSLEALPQGLAQRIFALLPVDARARCATVCRGWRTLLGDASLWTRLDLSAESGVTVRVNDAVLRGAAARAGGALQALDVDVEQIGDATMLAVVTSNAGTLRELRLRSSFHRVDDLTPLLRAASALRTLHATAFCAADRALPLLRNEPPYGPLRLTTLRVSAAASDEAGLLALAAALPAHASLRELELHASFREPLQSDAACGAVLEAALAARLTSFTLGGCALSPAPVPALVRLLGGGALSKLTLFGCAELLDEPAAVASLAAALRDNVTLTSLTLVHMGLWRAHVPGAALLEALVRHRNLQSISCFANPPDDDEAAAAAGAALGALLAADAPALIYLDVRFCHLGDAALRPLIDALPRCTHLRDLDILGNDISEAFAAARLLPAVRANTSLRQLEAGVTHPSVAEAERLVRACGEAEAAAA